MSNYIGYIPRKFTNNPITCIYNPNPGYTQNCNGGVAPNRPTISGGGTSPPSPPPPPPPPLLNKITSQFTLYRNMLPISIPSSASPLTDPNYSWEDSTVSKSWLTDPSIKNPYSDSSSYLDDNGNEHLQNDWTKWQGFIDALSKCIELDGTNGKKNCYAISVQSDFTGVSIADSKNGHSYNYNLVELPTIDNINPNFASGKQIDHNFLFCQPQFYTWVKNPPAGTVYNPYAPSFKPSGTPSRTPGSVSLRCADEQYPSQVNSGYQELKPPDDFWAPSPEVEIPFVPQKKKIEDNSKRNIIIGVVVVIVLLVGGYYWYTHMGPGKPATVAASAPTVAASAPKVAASAPKVAIQKTKGGYYYYY